MRRTFIAIAVILPLILLAQSAEGARFNPFGNLIYESLLDPNMILIAPNNNRTLSMGFSYEYHFYDTDPVNYTIRYNETPIAFKAPNQKALIGRFYVNSTTFSINVVRWGLNGTELLTVHYIAAGGLPHPWEDTNPEPEPDYLPAPGAAPLTRAQVTDLTLKALLAIFIIIPLVVFWVKRIKEHSTTAGTLGMADNYYRSPDDGEKE